MRDPSPEPPPPVFGLGRFRVATVAAAVSLLTRATVWEVSPGVELSPRFTGLKEALGMSTLLSVKGSGVTRSIGNRSLPRKGRWVSGVGDDGPASVIFLARSAQLFLHAAKAVLYEGI